MEWHTRELRDLAVAWFVLGVAFTILLGRDVLRGVLAGNVDAIVHLGPTFLISMITVGVGFMLHELAHKVVAIHYGQRAAFRADYSMLFIALVGSFVGFLFAAPGAVYHRGHATKRENGLIALAGPVTNIVLCVVFFVLLLIATVLQMGFLSNLANIGLLINVLLAGFNMIPFGPLDGRTVLDWNKLVFALVALPSFGLVLFVFFV